MLDQSPNTHLEMGRDPPPGPITLTTQEAKQSAPASIGVRYGAAQIQLVNAIRYGREWLGYTRRNPRQWRGNKFATYDVMM
jgi:hypothetical protein